MNTAPTPAGAPEPAPDTEAGLRLLDCGRCGEPMYHRGHLEADYPLCRRWAFECGECGQRVDTWEHAWEDKPVPWHTATYKDGYAVE